MKTLLTILFLSFGLMLSAQQIEKDGKQYEVKDGKIYLEGKDVTETFTVEQRKVFLEEAAKIATTMKLKSVEAASQKKAEKEINKAEKAQKKAEKQMKKAEKALKKQEKAQKNFDKATSKLEKTQKKYKKQKRKGKLSPADEKELLEKIEKLGEKVEKAKRKL